MTVDLFEFIIYQQLEHPYFMEILFMYGLSLIGISTIGFWLISLIHGFPTQKIFYSKTEASDIPEKQYVITGKLKDEFTYRNEHRKMLEKNRKMLFEWAKRNKRELLIVAVFMLVYLIVNSIISRVVV